MLIKGQWRSFLQASEDRWRRYEGFYFRERLIALYGPLEPLLPLYVGEEEENLVAHTREETRQGDKTTHKLLNFFDIGGDSHVNDKLEFVQTFFDSALWKHEPKELSRLYPEGTLGVIQAHVVLHD